jgi:DNA-binding transcriptional regulator YiaG
MQQPETAEELFQRFVESALVAFGRSIRGWKPGHVEEVVLRVCSRILARWPADAEGVRTLARDAKAAGIPIGVLTRIELLKLLDVLDAKQDLIDLSGTLTPEDDKRARKLFGLEAGRPPGVRLDDAEIAALKAARGKQSRPSFARSYRISVDTIERAEQGKTISKDMRRKILKTITTKHINQLHKPQKT